MTRIIVTGGCGFIGSNFLHHMVEKYPNYIFVNIDKLTYSGNLENVKELEGKQNYSFVQEDIINKEKISKIIQEGDIIVNFAAESHVDNSIFNSEIFVKTNVLGTQNLLDIAREKKVKLFIQISTDEVYGSLNFYDNPSLEEDKLNPSSPYSSSKAAAEMFCLSNIRTFNQPIIITRSSNNFGPKQFTEKIIPLFVTNLIEGKRVPLYGEGKNIRDWIYVLDNCEAIDFLIHKGIPGNIYNIGGDNEIQNIDLVKKILSGMNKEEFYIDYVKDRLGHDLRYGLNCSKIKNLGWRPRFNFNDALKETINWYENNGQWWRPLKNVKENSNKKIKYLIFGKGYLGKKFNDFLEDSSISDLRIENKESVIKEIEKYNPDFVINCVGKTGRPNVDWCEDHKEETTFSNITVPLMIASACQETSKKMVHIGSGCIYNGDNGGKGFSEEDESNFYGSYLLKHHPDKDQVFRLGTDPGQKN